jgi:hypothetical protein
MFCIVFSFKNKFFLRETRERFEGVQLRGPVKGVACPRSSQTLDREHRWKNAGCEKARVEWGKNGEENVFGQEHRMEKAICSACGKVGAQAPIPHCSAGNLLVDVLKVLQDNPDSPNQTRILTKNQDLDDDPCCLSEPTL